MSDARSLVAEQFDDLPQERETNTLGMWIFLATEVMFFGVLFLGYTVYRGSYPVAFADASRHLNTLIGGVNTAVLLCSSTAMALAIHAIQVGQRRNLIRLLLLTALLGIVFMVLKAIEYYGDYREHLMPLFGLPFIYDGPAPEQAKLFFHLYYIMTGFHALHLTIGIIVILIMAFLSWRGHFSAEKHIPVELTGLYWHFVDIVWIFLFPLLYLIGKHKL